MRFQRIQDRIAFGIRGCHWRVKVLGTVALDSGAVCSYISEPAPTAYISQGMLIIKVMPTLSARVLWIRTKPIIRFLADRRHAAAVLTILEIIGKGRAAPTGSGEWKVATQRGELYRDEGAHKGEANAGNADVGFDDNPNTSGDDGPGGVCLYDGGEQWKADNAGDTDTNVIGQYNPNNRTPMESTHKQPSKKMPISASFFVHARRKCQSHGMGKMSMMILTASSDPVMPQDSVCSLIQ